MRIAFIRPNMYDGRSADAMEPLCFAVIKALTPPDIQTVLYDERLERIPLDLAVDLVALTVETYTARRAYQIADAFRARGVPVVMGGYHPTFLPDEALQHADAVVCGDAEDCWPRLLEDVARGSLRPLYRSDLTTPLGGIQPDRSVFACKRYAPVGMVQYGRGCRFNCTFCSVRAFYGRSVRQRPVAEVIEDIRRCGRRHIFLVDDNLFVDESSARALFEALLPLGVHWSCQVSIDIARQPALVELMARSGCISVLVGFESLDPRNLGEIHKSWNLKWQSYDSAIAVFRQAGIMIYGTFVLGCDADTVASFGSVVNFAVRNRFALANFNPLTPMPGAPLYERMQREGRLLHDRWWLDDAFRYGDATLRPRNMAPGQLTEGCFAARRRFNSLASIAYRLSDRRTNLRSPYRTGLYLLANLTSRREVRAKQGRRLGAVAEPGRPGGGAP